MPRNIEIKAKIDNLTTFMGLVENIVDLSSGKVLEQNDTFFNTQNGRLKLRVQPDLKELIFYDRPNQDGPKLCNYAFYNPDDSEKLKEVLRQAYGIRGIVEKKRTLFMAGQTRIHVDEVKGLGNFMELEVVLRDNQSIEEGQKITEELMKKLNVHQTDLIGGAYMDLIEKNL